MNPTPLQGDVALVTGAAGGIGRAVCEALRHAGATVIAADLRSGPGIDLALDVADEAAWVQAIAMVEQAHGRLDILVNNAGISVVRSIAETSLDDWRRVHAVNSEGIFLGVKHATGLMRRSGADRAGGASIVNMSSVAGLRGAAFNAAYCASKGDVRLFTKSAALEFAALGYRIRVNSVHPGGIATDMMRSIVDSYVELGAMPDAEEAQKNVDALHPLGRMGEPAEIAAGVLFLASPSSSYMTGAELVIDGGFTAR